MVVLVVVFGWTQRLEPGVILEAEVVKTINRARIEQLSLFNEGEQP